MLSKNINLEELRPAISLDINDIFSLSLFRIHCIQISLLVQGGTFVFI